MILETKQGNSVRSKVESMNTGARAYSCKQQTSNRRGKKQTNERIRVAKALRERERADERSAIDGSCRRR